MDSEIFKKIHKLLEVKDIVKEIHPTFKGLYPLAVLSARKLHIFNNEKGRYIYSGSFDAPNWMNKKILAAFPLEANSYRMTCVVSEDTFNTLEGLVFILHEFVHCYQFEKCELRVKEKLSIARKFESEGKFDWELIYSFPYSNAEFVEAYSSFLESFTKDFNRLKGSRSKLRRILSLQDFEYMVWVEWKEGFARYLENRVRNSLGLKENHSGSKAPFSRITFYEGGARLVEFLLRLNPRLDEDLEGLFWKIRSL